MLKLVKKLENMQKLAFFDIDKTIHNGWSTYQYVECLVNEGISDKSNLDKLNQIFKDYESGKYASYEATNIVFMETSMAALANVSLEQIEQIKPKFQKYTSIYPWVNEVMQYLQEESYAIFFVSAALTPACHAIIETLGLDNYEIFSSEEEIIGDKYTGKSKRVLVSAEKLETVKSTIKTTESSFTASFGDSSGDIGMFEMTDVAFLVNPHEDGIVAQAQENGWYTPTTATDIIEVLKQKTANLPS